MKVIFYSLREVASKMSPVLFEEFYAFAYILFYEKNGMLLYCAVDRSGKDVLNWGNEFGIDHYLVFEMKIF